MLTLGNKNRLLQTIRTQQLQLQQLQQNLPSLHQQSGQAVSPSATAIVVDIPTSEPSLSSTVSPNTRTRSPAPTRAAGPTGHESPFTRPLSSSQQHHQEDASVPGSTSTNRDEMAFYQAEAQMLTRENQMLRQRIRELGTSTRFLP